MEKMSESPEFGDLLKISSSYKNNIGANIPIETYQLDKRQSIAVAAKLNTALLMRVIDRWQELEAANKVPQTFIEAMQLATDLLKVRHDKSMVKVTEMAASPEFGAVSKTDIVYNEQGQTIETYQVFILRWYCQEKNYERKSNSGV